MIRKMSVTTLFIAVFFILTGIRCENNSKEKVSGKEVSPSKVIMKIDGTPVTFDVFANAMVRDFGAKYYPLFINNFILENLAKKHNIKVDEKEVEKKVDKFFEDIISKRFRGDKKKFEAILKRNDLTIDSFRQKKAAEFKREAVAEQLIRMDLEKDEKKIKQEFEKKYGKDGVKYQIRQILLSINVNKSKLYTKEEFDKDKDGIEKEAQGKAKTLRDQLKSPEDFKKAAKENSDDVSGSRQGSLGKNWKKRFGPEFDEMVEKTGLGDISQPFKTQRGYQILLVDEISKGWDFKGKVIFAAIRAPHGHMDRFQKKGEKVNRENFMEKAKQKIETIHEKLKKGEKFEEIAKKESDDWASKRNGGDLGLFHQGRFGREADKILETIELNKFSEPVKTDKGFYIFYLTERKRNEKFDVKLVSHILISTQFAKVKERKLKGKIKELAKERGEKILAELKKGTDFAETAKKESEDNLTIQTGGTINNYSPASVTPKIHDEVITKMKKGDLSQLLESNKGFHIIKMDDVKKTEYNEVKKELLENLKKQPIRGFEINKYLDDLKKKIKIEKMIEL